MDNKKSGRDKLLVFLGVLIILVFSLYITLYFYKIYRDNNPKTESNKSSEIDNDKKKPEGKPDEENKIVKNNDIIDYDTLNSKIETDSKMNIIEKCECPENPDETNTGKCTKYVIDNENATKIINKLMESKEVQKLSTSSFCSAYSFTLKDENDNTIINGFVGDNKQSILVGYESEGYAFDYEEEIIGLFDSLVDGATEYTENN